MFYLIWDVAVPPSASTVKREPLEPEEIPADPSSAGHPLPPFSFALLN